MKMSQKKLWICTLGALLIASTVRAEITILADKVLRDRPIGIGGVVINAHSNEFATDAGGIAFQADLKAARVGLVRNVNYPDPRDPDHDPAYFDANVKAIQDAGAIPLFIQMITPKDVVDRHGKTTPKYLNSDGKIDGTGTPATNIVQRVKHYLEPPYSIGKQYWEVGNEPDNAIDYGVKSGAEYAAVFNEIDAALKAANLREHVILCGPASINNYNWPKRGGLSTDLMDTFLDQCKDAVDVVTIHSYTGGKGDPLGVMWGHKLENLFDTSRLITPKDDYGLASLQKKMDAIHFGRPGVGVGVTEHNTQADNFARGLWNLAVYQYLMYDPHGVLDTGFVFDDFGKQQGGFGAYNDQKQRGYLYWALWMHGNLTGTQVLQRNVTGNTNKEGKQFLLVAATRDASTLYIEVINRSDKPITDPVRITGASLAASGEVFTLSGSTLPDKSAPVSVSAAFDYTFPAGSATVLKLPISAAGTGG